MVQYALIFRVFDALANLYLPPCRISTCHICWDLVCTFPSAHSPAFQRCGQLHLDYCPPSWPSVRSLSTSYGQCMYIHLPLSSVYCTFNDPNQLNIIKLYLSFPPSFSRYPVPECSNHWGSVQCSAAYGCSLSLCTSTLQTQWPTSSSVWLWKERTSRADIKTH